MSDWLYWKDGIFLEHKVVEFKEYDPKDKSNFILKQYWGYIRHGIFHQHSEFGPSCIFRDKDFNIIFESYCIHGKYYRERGPYWIEYNTDGTIKNSYYIEYNDDGSVKFKDPAPDK